MAETGGVMLFTATTEERLPLQQELGHSCMSNTDSGQPQSYHRQRGLGEHIVYRQIDSISAIPT